MTTGDRQLREWVEELAVRLEGDGLPRMAGRIFGWLLVCEPTEQSMENLAAALQGSKASMSTMTRLLVGAGLVERVRRPGARRDVFRVREGSWGGYWEAQLKRLEANVDCLSRGARLIAGRPAAARARLEGVLAQYRFLERELWPLLKQRWTATFGSARPEAVISTRSAPGETPRRPTTRRNVRATRA